MEKESKAIPKESLVKKGIIFVSVLIPIVVAVLLFMPEKLDIAADWVYFLPHLNAVINSLTTVVLLLGLVLIQQGKVKAHGRAMTVAFLLGATFLVSYVIYHSSAESTPYGGEGLIRTVYFTLLISHIILAAVALFPILFAYYYGYTDQRQKHKKIVKFAFPVWLYVSISGVIVYLMIAPYYTH